MSHNLAKVLLDSDVLIDFLRRRQLAADLMAEASERADLFISVITVAEILAGMRPSEENATNELLSGFTILPVTEDIARLAGALRHRVSSKKALLADCLIAATALREECTLLTFNHKDYPFSELPLYEAGN